MNLFWMFLYLLGWHWFADFVCQTRWQAENKSKNNVALLRHVMVYTWILFFATAWGFGVTGSTFLWFTLVNGALHFITDYFTSRVSSHFYKKADWHSFFAVIGFDQLIHQTTFAVTLWGFYRQW